MHEPNCSILAQLLEKVSANGNLINTESEFVVAETEVYVMELTCVVKPFKKQKWNLYLSRSGMQLIDTEGESVIAVTPEAASSLLQIPGGTSKYSHLGVDLAGVELKFKIIKQDLEVLHRYVDTVAVAAGPESLNEIRKGAMRQLVLGIGGLIALAAFIILLAVLGVKPKQIGQLWTWLPVGVIASLFALARGMNGLKRHRRLVEQLDVRY